MIGQEQRLSGSGGSLFGKMQRARALAIWSLVLVMLLALSATVCAKTKITFFVFGGAENQYPDPVVLGAKERFEATHPNIEVEVLKGSTDRDTYMQQLQIRVATGLQTDLMTPQPHWFLPTIKFAADLTPYMKRDGISNNDFMPSTIDSYIIDGKVTGLPLSIVLRGSVYNARLLQEGGINPPAPDAWTWDTVKSIGKKMTIDKTGDGKPEIYGVDTGGAVGTLLLLPLASQAGGMFFDRYVDPTKSLLNSEASRTAFKYRIYFHTEGITSTTARVYSGNAAYGMDAYPEYMNTFTENLGHSDAVFIPAPSGPVRGGFQIGAQGLQMLTMSKNPNEAWEFLKYFTMSMDEIRIRFELGQRGPSALKRALPMWFQYKDEIASFDNWLTVANDPDNTPRYSFRTAQVELIIRNIMRDIIGGKTPFESGIAEMHRQVQIELDQGREAK